LSSTKEVSGSMAGQICSKTGHTYIHSVRRQWSVLLNQLFELNNMIFSRGFSCEDTFRVFTILQDLLGKPWTV